MSDAKLSLGDNTTFVTISAAVVRFNFEPKEDITAYELACLLPYFFGRAPTEDEWKRLGTSTRHCRRLD